MSSKIPYNKFPCGMVTPNFLTTEVCEKLKACVYERATWVPALVAKYDGNDYLGNENDPNISTALVTKEFRFQTAEIDVSAVQSQILSAIEERFGIKPDRFSDYGISKYPTGSKLAPHSDTGVYNTKRLITCIIYLEPAIEGGILNFPEIGHEVIIQTGMLVCFYSELKHEVTEITRGERVALIFFAEAS